MSAPHQPTVDTRSKVEGWAMWGVPHEDICVMLTDLGGKITTKTLRKHYKRELALGRAKAHAAIGGKLFSSAMKGSVPLMIYYTKAQMGWREVHHVAQQDPDGRPLGSALRDAPAPVTLEDAESRYAEFVHAAPPPPIATGKPN